jgi:hypothetical protein
MDALAAPKRQLFRYCGPASVRLAFLRQQSVNVPMLPMEYGMAKPRFPKVEELDSLDLAALRQVWTSLFPCPAPARMPRGFLLKLVAQGLQEREIGGLPKHLERALADALRARETKASDGTGDSLSLGTRLVRTWGDDKHEVIVLEDGFAYRGKAYGSLSEIARLITGARWSGPRFFGLKSSEARA